MVWPMAASTIGRRAQPTASRGVRGSRTAPSPSRTRSSRCSKSARSVEDCGRGRRRRYHHGMPRAKPTAEERYARLVAHFAKKPHVTWDAGTAQRGQRFGASAVKVNNKIFAMLTRGSLVVKLPAARVDELVASGQGQRFDAGKGRPMKEWLALD